MAFKKKKTSFMVALLFLLTAFMSMQTSTAASGVPPIAEAGGPYFGEEGSPIELNASGSNDIDGDRLTYRWNISGLWVENYYLPYMSWIWFDDFSGVITLEVSDGTNIATDTADVSIVNVPPRILSIEGPTAVDVETEVFITVNFNALPEDRYQSGLVDTYVATFFWDDGNSTELALSADDIWANASYVYKTEDMYHIVCSIVDNNGGEASTVWDVMVGDIQLVDAGPDCVIDEGSMFVSHGCLVDADSPFYRAMVDYYDGMEAQPLSLNPGNTFDLRHIYVDDGEYPVLVMVFNDGMEYGEDTVVVTVLNVPPVFESLTISPTNGVQPGVPIELSGMFVDPGMLDLHTVTIDWGDGSLTTYATEPSITSVHSSHSYKNAGNYQIVVSVVDDGGGSCQASLPVVVKTASASMDVIKEIIASLKIPKGLKYNLLLMLEKVPSLMKHHRIQATIHQLQAFIHYVQAHYGRQLPRDQAQELIKAARLMIDTLKTR